MPHPSPRRTLSRLSKVRIVSLTFARPELKRYRITPSQAAGETGQGKRERSQPDRLCRQWKWRPL